MQELFRRIVGYMLDQYMTVLFVLAATISITYLIIIYNIRDQEGNATLITLSWEQSFLVESINYDVSLLNPATGKQDKTKAKGRIANKMARLADIHDVLKDGSRFIKSHSKIVRKPGVLTVDLLRLYTGGDYPINQLMRRFQSSLRAIQKTPVDELHQNHPLVLKIQSQLSPPLLEGLARATSYYKQETEMMLEGTKNRQNFLFVINLGILGILGSSLLQPLVTRLRESTLKAESEKAFADNILNTAQALIVGLDGSQNVVLFNEFAEETTGWPTQEVQGKNFFQTFIPDRDQQKLQDLFTELMSGDSEYAEEVETQFAVSTGELINVVWHSTTILDVKKKKPSMFLITGNDVTERLAAEQNLQKAHSEMEVLSNRLLDEVNLAATLQQSILPDPIIELPGIQGHANLLTSSEVGGDYYDYYKIGSHQSIVLVGDVSGHGVAAGTMVSAAKAGVYPLIHEGITNPAEILKLLNETMLVTAQQSLLMTMNCISLDSRTGKLQFANAGHVLPYLWRHQQQHWEMLEASGLPLGKSIEADYSVSAIELEMEVGDRLFLFTDGLVEEESPDGEAFGYDRLEDILSESGEVEAEIIREQLMLALTLHCETDSFSDDVSIVVLTHSDRVAPETNRQDDDISDILRINEGFYRKGDHPIPPISREYLVLTVENEFADLLERMSQDGICRILPKQSEFCQKIGWNQLLNQHRESPDDDLYVLMPPHPQQRQFQLTHTDDKLFVMEEIISWLADTGEVSEDHREALMVILDEMIENSLYAAPRDGKGAPYYQKGQSRELGELDEVRINVALSDNVLGLMITDNWGTLPSSVFLKKLAQAMDAGVEAGIGGAGLYMMWRLSDYMQIRTHPQQRTQVTTLWDLDKPIDMDVSSGFQFIQHSEYAPMIEAKARA